MFLLRTSNIFMKFFSRYFAHNLLHYLQEPTTFEIYSIHCSYLNKSLRKLNDDQSDADKL